MVSRSTEAPVPLGEYVPTADGRILMGNKTWDDWEALLAIRGEKSSPRMAFLDGTVELMSPSRDHEVIKSCIGRLIEAYCYERGIGFSPVGAWLQKEKDKEAGAEPDECYVFEPDSALKQRPDLVIEVVWTSGGIDKLEIYRRYGIAEAWFWQADAITIHVLTTGGYEQAPRSRGLPDLDLALLSAFVRVQPVSEAVRQYRAALRG
ncbi:MAG: Uma2 family endonuclease [Myxococcota bacterium]|nr:Uma2 family endonuclease [Myxococcota bacterium]